MAAAAVPLAGADMPSSVHRGIHRIVGTFLGLAVVALILFPGPLSPMLTRVDSEVVWTKERLGKWLSIGGFSSSVVGSPTTIANELERWMEIADVDGFNFGRVVAPGTMEDFVDLVVPELRKRGHEPGRYFFHRRWIHCGQEDAGEESKR